MTQVRSDAGISCCCCFSRSRARRRFRTRVRSAPGRSRTMQPKWSFGGRVHTSAGLMFALGVHASGRNSTRGYPLSRLQPLKIGEVNALLPCLLPLVFLCDHSYHTCRHRGFQRPCSGLHPRYIWCLAVSLAHDSVVAWSADCIKSQRCADYLSCRRWQRTTLH